MKKYLNKIRKNLRSVIVGSFLVFTSSVAYALYFEYIVDEARGVYITVGYNDDGSWAATFYIKDTGRHGEQTADCMLVMPEFTYCFSY